MLINDGRTAFIPQVMLKETRRRALEQATAHPPACLGLCPVPMPAHPRMPRALPCPSVSLRSHHTAPCAMPPRVCVCVCVASRAHRAAAQNEERVPPVVIASGRV